MMISSWLTSKSILLLSWLRPWSYLQQSFTMAACQYTGVLNLEEQEDINMAFVDAILWLYTVNEGFYTWKSHNYKDEQRVKSPMAYQIKPCSHL